MSQVKKFKGAKELLAAEDLVTEEVFVESWASWVRVRTMSGHDRDEWEQAMLGQRTKGKFDNIRARLVAMTAVDEGGARLFSDDQITALGQKSARALEQIYEVAARLNRLTEKDVAELEGNSGAGRSGAPGSDSPAR